MKGIEKKNQLKPYKMKQNKSAEFLPIDEYSYKNSIPFDVYCHSQFSIVNDIVLQLRNEIDFENKHDKAKLRKTVNKVVVNLFLASLVNNRWVGLSRRTSDYGKNHRNGKIYLSYKTTMFCCDRLEELGYTETRNGYFSFEYPEDNHTYRMRATSKLKKMFDGLYACNVEYENDFEPIVMNDVNKKNITHSNPPEAQRSRKNLFIINNLLKEADIGISMSKDELHQLNYQRGQERKPAIYTFRKYLKRIFCRKNWRLGGRLYCGFWQSIPKELRHLVTINGEETVELDFDCLHPQLLYAQETGRLCEEDIYSLGGRYQKGSVMREIIKYAFLVMINAATEDSCEFKIDEAISEAKRNRPEEMVNHKNLNAEIVMKKILEAHPELKNSLCSDAGVKLQYKDSKIALGILLALAKEKIVALPIHDSFIVQARHEERLRQVMEEEFRKVVGDTPGISKKKNPVAGVPQADHSSIQAAFETEYEENSIYY